MADDIEIIRVKPSPARESEPNILHGKRQTWYDIEITLRNKSQNTIYVVSDIRRLSYDSASQTLNLVLSEQPPSPEAERIHIHRTIPKVTAVPAGETKTLSVAVPAVIKRIGSSASLGMPVETIDVSGFKQIHVTVAYSQTPFERDPSESSLQMQRRLADWGKTVETIAAAERSDSPRPSGSVD